MKTLFPGYYCKDEQEFKSLWKDCLFVLDTNVLLDIYRYSPTSASEILDVLESVKERLWIPYQVAKEYHSKLYDTIREQSATYKDAIKKIGDLSQRIVVERRHPFLPECDLDRFSDFCKEFMKKLEEQYDKIHSLLLKNQYKDRLADLLEGRVNVAQSEEKLAELREEGRQRYEKKIPPGYKDADKSGDRMYGDFILWSEVKEYAEQNKKNIVLVTNEQKEDWFLRVDGLTICARPELIAEFRQDTAQKIYICSLKKFMDNLKDYMDVSITQTVVDEIQEQQQIKQDEKTEAGGDELNFSREETSTLQDIQSLSSSVILPRQDNTTSANNS